MEEEVLKIDNDVIPDNKEENVVNTDKNLVKPQHKFQEKEENYVEVIKGEPT